MGLHGQRPRTAAAHLEDSIEWPSSLRKVVASTSPVPAGGGNQWGSPVDIGHLFEEAAATALQSAWRGRVIRRDLTYEAASNMLQSAWQDPQESRHVANDQMPEQMPQLKRKDFDKRTVLPQMPELSRRDPQPAGLQMRHELAPARDTSSSFDSPSEPRHLGSAMRGEKAAMRHQLARPPPEAWLPVDSSSNLEVSFGREHSLGYDASVGNDLSFESYDRDPQLRDGFGSPRSGGYSPAPMPPDLPSPPRRPPPLDPSIRIVLQGMSGSDASLDGNYAGPPVPSSASNAPRYTGPPPPSRRREEALRAADDERLFDRIDTNRDGLISRQEYESAVKSGILSEDDIAAFMPSSSSRAPIRDDPAEDSFGRGPASRQADHQELIPQADRRRSLDFLDDRLDLEDKRIRDDPQSQEYVANWKEARLREEKQFEAERADIEAERRREDQWWEDHRREDLARQEQKRQMDEQERKEIEDARERRQAELLRIKGWYRNKDEEREEKKEFRERVKEELRQAEEAKRQAEEAKKQAEELKREAEKAKKEEERLRQERAREQDFIEERRREAKTREAQIESQFQAKRIEEEQLAAKRREERRREEEQERQRKEEKRREEEKEEEKRREEKRKEDARHQERFQEERRREEERIKEEFRQYELKMRDQTRALEERRQEEEEAKRRLEKMKEDLRREEEHRLEKLRWEEMKLEERRQQEEDARQKELKLREEVRLQEEKRLQELKKEEERLLELRLQDEARRREDEKRLFEEEQKLEEIRLEEERRREEAKKEEEIWEERRRQDEIRRKDEFRLEELKREERRIEEKMQYEEWKAEQRSLEESWRRDREEEERRRRENDERLRNEELQKLETRSFQDEESDSSAIGSRRSPGGAREEYRLRRLEEELAEEEERNRIRALQIAKSEVEAKLREERLIAAEDVAKRKIDDFKEEELKVRRRQEELAAEQKRREHHMEKIREMERDVDRREADLRQREQQLRNMEQDALHRQNALKHLEQKARQREKELETIEEGYAEKAVDSDLTQRRLAMREAELEVCAKDIAEREIELREREAKIAAFREQSLFERQTLELRARELEGHIDELEILEEEALLQAAFRAWKHVKVAADMEKDKKIKHVVLEKEIQRRPKTADDADAQSSSASNQEPTSPLYEPVLPPLTLVSDVLEDLPRVQPLPRSPLRSNRSDSGGNSVEEGSPTSSPAPGQRFPDGTAWVIDTSDWPEPEDEQTTRFDPDRSRRQFEMAKRKMEIHMQAQAERERRIQQKLEKERKNREKLWQGPTHIQAREHERQKPEHVPKSQPLAAAARLGPGARHETRNDKLRPKAASKGRPAANLIAPSGIPASPAFGSQIPSPKTPKAASGKRAARGKGAARSATPTRQARPAASPKAKSSNARSASTGPRLVGGHGSWNGREDLQNGRTGRRNSFDELDDELLWAHAPPLASASRRRSNSNDEQVPSASKALSSRCGPRELAQASRSSPWLSEGTRSSPQLQRTASNPAQDPPALTAIGSRGVSARSAREQDSSGEEARPWWAKDYPNTRAVNKDHSRR